MPCNSITSQSVGGLEKALPDLVKAALLQWSGNEARIVGAGILGAWGRGGEFATWAPGEGLRVKVRSGTPAQADTARAEVMQAYSRAAVSYAAKRAGWRVQSVPGAVNRLVVQRG